MRFGAIATIGNMAWSLDGASLPLIPDGVTLEDAVREGPKIPGETAIPVGRYRLVISQSVRFGRRMPEVLDVPGFTGIRIHAGNTDGNTEGCILVGTTVIGDDFIAESAVAFGKFFARLELLLGLGINVWFEITGAPPAAAA